MGTLGAMNTLTHDHTDARTGRPLDGEHEAVESLTDEELEREITIAALDSKRSCRFDALFAERRRRAKRRDAA